MRKIALVLAALAAALAAGLLMATLAAARPLPQLALTSIEPTFLVSQAGGNGRGAVQPTPPPLPLSQVKRDT